MYWVNRLARHRPNYVNSKTARNAGEEFREMGQQVSQDIDAHIFEALKPVLERVEALEEGDERLNDFGARLKSLEDRFNLRTKTLSAEDLERVKEAIIAASEHLDRQMGLQPFTMAELMEIKEKLAVAKASLGIDQEGGT